MTKTKMNDDLKDIYDWITKAFLGVLLNVVINKALNIIFRRGE